MTPWFADTSFFIALLSPSDTAHEAAVRCARELTAHPLVTSVWVLVELANACSSPRRRNGFRSTVEFLRGQPGATIRHFEQAGYAALLADR